MTADRPLFRELSSCLKWAFGYGVVRKPTALANAHRALMDTRNDTCPRGDYQKAADTIGVSVRELRDLLDPVLDREELPLPSRDPDLDRLPGRDDAPAQAGLILGFVHRRPRPERQHLIAKFAFGEDRRQAQRELRDYLRPLVNDMLKPNFVIYTLIARFYGLPVEDGFLPRRVLHLVPGNTREQRQVAAKRMVDGMAVDIEGWLQPLATRCEELATDELRARGVIA